MPYVSKAQRGLFHSANSPVSAKVVAEFDRASKGQRGLPERVQRKAHGGQVESFSNQRAEEALYEKRFNRRKQDDVLNPRKATDIAFAAHLAEKARKRPSASLFHSKFRKVSP